MYIREFTEVWMYFSSHHGYHFFLAIFTHWCNFYEILSNLVWRGRKINQLLVKPLRHNIMVNSNKNYILPVACNDPSNWIFSSVFAVSVHRLSWNSWKVWLSVEKSNITYNSQLWVSMWVRKYLEKSPLCNTDFHSIVYFACMYMLAAIYGIVQVCAITVGDEPPYV